MSEKTVLIANRGEIALRIIRTAKRLGYRTVSVYSEADRQSPHVSAADESYALGGVSAQESYLDLAKMLIAAQASSAEMIHPGYGFLSEKAAFAEAVKAAGLTFVGPSAYTLQVLGQKHSAVKLAQSAAVPTIPAILLESGSTKELSAAAKELGFPLMVKACLGGGGKGMRLVTAPGQLKEAAAAAKREALAYFANGDLMLEKVLSSVRHVEVQVARDTIGNACHLFERECSVQRRNQKIIEECPAPHLKADIRASLFSDAVKLANVSKLTGIATVEFLVDESGYYFLEVNPRLQVEHPVTEFVSGLDLVELQFLIAEGSVIPERYLKARTQGHAVEARIYAEIPELGFIPSSGQITLLSLPAENETLRLEHALYGGMKVGTAYDPMLAKVISYGSSRNEALAGLEQALNKTAIVGVDNNLAFLKAVLRHPRLKSAAVCTTFIEKEQKSLKNRDDRVQLSYAALSYLLLVRAITLSGTDSPFSPLHNWRAANVLRPKPLEENWQLQCVPLELDTEIRISLLDLRRGPGNAILFKTAAKGKEFTGEFASDLFKFGNQNYPVKSSLSRHAYIFGEGLEFSFAAYNFQASLIKVQSAALQKTDREIPAIVSPLPGTVLKLKTAAGKKVKKGETLLIIESMKMEHNIPAPRDGVVAQILVKSGQNVRLGQALVQLKDI